MGTVGEMFRPKFDFKRLFKFYLRVKWSMYKYGYVYSTIQNDFVEPLISKHGKAKSLQRRLI